MELHIAIIPEQIGEWLGVPITNTLITSWVAMGVLIAFAFLLSRILTLKPGKIQNFIEMIFEYILDFMDEVLGDRKLTKFFFPLIATLFLFIWLSNWMEFLPGIGSIGIGGHCGGPVCEPLFRSVNTDLNVTIALAIISVAVTEIAGLYFLGAFGYLKKFLNFSRQPLRVSRVELAAHIGMLDFLITVSHWSRTPDCQS